MNFRRRIRPYFLSFLKYYFNPLTRQIAYSTVGPFAIIRHVGRRSGKPYETPIMVAPIFDGFVIELTYGPEVDWYKNIVAAGGCTVIWHGKNYTINMIKILDEQSGAAAFSPLIRVIIRIARMRYFAKLTAFRPNAGLIPPP